MLNITYYAMVDSSSSLYRLRANNVYKFRVLAQNKIGISDPSNPSTGKGCAVDPARPELNPRGVRTLDEGDNKLVITWQVCLNTCACANYPSLDEASIFI